MIANLLLLASLSTAMPTDARSSCSVDLQVEPALSRFDLSDHGVLSAEHLRVGIRNTGTTTTTLVEPGNGSDAGWRTPIVTWQVELVGGVYTPPGSARCGNMNPLRPDEVFDLEPGEVHGLGDWVPHISVAQVGTYRLRLKYENDPTLQWRSISPFEHDPSAMQRVRNSTPCVAISNEVVVGVTAVPKR